MFVTHDQEEALVLSDRIAVMRAGQIEQIGEAEVLYERPRTRFVGQFLGSCNLIEGKVTRGGERQPAGRDAAGRADARRRRRTSGRARSATRSRWRSGPEKVRVLQAPGDGANETRGAS